MALAAALLAVKSVAFQHLHQPTQYVHGSIVFSTAADLTDTSTGQPAGPKPTFYKRIDGMWRRRKLLNELFIGERLFATRIPQCDYIDGVTGPKIFLECGVGRMKEGKVRSVNGMLRLGKLTGRKNRMKESVIRKKIAKIPEDKMIEVYVSRINLDHGTFEGK